MEQKDTIFFHRMTFLVHDKPHDVIDVGVDIEISFLLVRVHLKTFEEKKILKHNFLTLRKVKELKHEQ